MPDDPSPLDPLIDLFLYAPIGMIYEYPDVLETLVKRGKSQVQLAKLVTQMAKQGQGNAGLTVEDGVAIAAKLVDKVMADVGGALSAALGLPTTTTSPAAPSPATTSPAAPRAPRTAAPSAAPPMAGYDGLKAREIVALVPDLSAAQRSTVLTYEQANKKRKTVLAALGNHDG